MSLSDDFPWELAGSVVMSCVRKENFFRELKGRRLYLFRRVRELCENKCSVFFFNFSKFKNSTIIAFGAHLPNDICLAWALFRPSFQQSRVDLEAILESIFDRRIVQTDNERTGSCKSEVMTWRKHVQNMNSTFEKKTGKIFKIHENRALS